MIYESCDGLESFTRDPIEYYDGPNLFSFLSASPLSWFDPSGLCAEPPETAVTIKTKSKIEVRYKDFEKTLEEMRKVKGGHALGATGFTMDVNTTFATGEQPCKMCCKGGGNGVLFYISSIDINLHFNIVTVIAKAHPAFRGGLFGWSDLRYYSGIE